MTNIEKDDDKSKCVYSSYGLAFDGKGEWNFGNGSGRNVIISGVDNTSSHSDYRKNIFFNVKGRGYFWY